MAKVGRREFRFSALLTYRCTSKDAVKDFDRVVKSVTNVEFEFANVLTSGGIGDFFEN